MTGTLDLEYRARQQFEAFHARKERWAVIVAHRRAGKTVACVMDLIDAALRCDKERPRFAYIAPMLKQAKTVSWDYVKSYGLKIPGATAHESELRLDLPNGAQVRLYGSDNPDGLRGIYLDGLVLDEAADMAPRVYSEILRPALSDRRGWCVWIGTPKGQNDFFDLWEKAQDDPAYFTLMLRASATGFVDALELADARGQMSPEQYAQEYECSFQAAIVGAYYGREMEEADKAKRICGNVYDPMIEVHTAWDLGINDQTAIWFYQQASLDVRVIDYYAANGYGLDHYAKILQSKNYKYGRHYLPHDVEVKELGTGRSRLETLNALGINATVVRKLSVEDGINAVRKILPRCWFDKDKCAEGIKALRQYRREWDERRKVFYERPLHDWCFTRETEVLTRYGTCRIDELPYEGEVLTPCGFKQYRRPRITRVNAPLVEVAFTDGLTVRCTPDHTFLTADGWRSAESLATGTQIQSSLTRSRSISMALSTVSGRARNTTRRAVRRYIGMLGDVPLALYRRAATSITETATPTTTRFPIWNAWIGANTSPLLGAPLTASGNPAKRLAMLLLSGIGLRLEGSGTNGMRYGRRVGPSGGALSALARSAASSFRRWTGRAAGASGSAIRTARPLTIAGVRALNETADVWCITVPDSECFSLANGAVVHNCSDPADAFRYLAVSLQEPFTKAALPRTNTGWIL